ncbi:hypothetical protein MVEN_00229100 [Mycena venus]|uniref:Uncharacterized protein n=1 Tax=Mycena venus TaxID=2733690 RepID=A0A8H6YYV4_9AGAR|nr:hypothetical protein MVEN_00229100 [Mycena venus]
MDATLTLQPHEQDAEPFDEALDRALAGNRLGWHKKIAAERRETLVNLEGILQELSLEHEALGANLNVEALLSPEPESLSDGPELDIDDKIARQIFAVTGELFQVGVRVHPYSTPNRLFRANKNDLSALKL